MGRVRILAAAISTLALIGSASVAVAESASTATPNQWGQQPTHHFFQWDQKGRWSLRLSMGDPVGRDLEQRDMQAGAYYRITPSLRVGGAVSFSDAPAQPDRTDLPQSQAPRVKLETSFKF
jgi:hypothetical protein